MTPEYLRKELQSLTAQRDNAAAVQQQAIGAIALAESLLEKLEQTDDTEEVVAEVIEEVEPSLDQ